MAGIIDNSKNNVIEEIKNRPIQFNAPFSNILFSDELPDILDNANKKISGEAIPYEALPIIAADIIDKVTEVNGPGHIGYLREIFSRKAEKLNYLKSKNIQ